MRRKTLILDEAQMRRSVTRMAHEIIERNKGCLLYTSRCV